VLGTLGALVVAGIAVVVIFLVMGGSTSSDENTSSAGPVPFQPTTTTSTRPTSSSTTTQAASRGIDAFDRLTVAQTYLRTLYVRSGTYPSTLTRTVSTAPGAIFVQGTATPGTTQVSYLISGQWALLATEAAGTCYFEFVNQGSSASTHLPGLGTWYGKTTGHACNANDHPAQGWSNHSP
jgi:hypothetical protein